MSDFFESLSNFSFFFFKLILFHAKASIFPKKTALNLNNIFRFNQKHFDETFKNSETRC